MAKKYISVFAAIQAKPEYLNENHENKDRALYAKGWNACNKEYIDNLLDIPAEDVRPMNYGHYITDELGDSKCSECGERYLDVTKNYCPNCGASLRPRRADNC